MNSTAEHQHAITVVIDDGMSTLGRPTGIGVQSMYLHRALQDVCSSTLTKYSFLERMPRLMRRPAYILAANAGAALFRADVIHYQNYYVPVLRRGMAVVSTIHDLTAFRFPETLPPWYRSYAQHSLRTSLKRADVLVAPSESMREEILACFTSVAPARVAHCPNGIRPEFLAVDRSTGPLPAGLRAQSYVLAVGTLERRKNIALLLDTWRSARKGGYVSNLKRLVLVGRMGFGSDEFAQTLRTDDSIVHLELCSDQELLSLYRGARVLVFPSLYEGFGFPVLEAMSQGVPIIVSDIPTNREFNGRHNSQMLMFPPADGRALLECLRRMDTDEVQRPPTLNYGDLSLYHPASVAKCHMELYRNILAVRHCRHQ